MKKSTAINATNIVIPAKAGIQQKQNAAQRTKSLSRSARTASTNWIPAFAGMTSGGVKTLVLALAAIGLASLPTHDVYANPQGGQVVAGSAAIVQQTPTKIGITQTTDKAIIDWRSYSIGANEHVQYYQPSAASVTLNRVVGADPSQILGRLTANGQVFLVNPNGIYFGKNAQIDVAGLVASTHNIRNEDFLAGKYIFNIPGKPGAAVINDGSIHIADTGIAAFVAPSVLNNGVIVAKLGKVMLASANGFTLDFSGDQLITFLVNDQVAQTAFDLQGNPLTSFVENAGRIEAQGGYVLLTAKAAENAIHSVINQTGSIEATTVGTHNGTIILNAGAGSLNLAGTLDASAPTGGDGGYIDTSGAHVTIDPTAKITTAAPYGKTGTWLLDPVDFTIAATGGDMTGSALSSALGLNNVLIQSISGAAGTAGDVNVNDIVTWSANKLTLNAQNNININAAMTGSGTASLSLEYGQGALAAGNLSDYLVHALVNLPAGQNFSTKLGSDGVVKNYTVITSLGAPGSMTATDLQGMSGDMFGNYVLGANIDARATTGWNAGAGFTPIATNLNQFFYGNFDGLGHNIFGLTINLPANSYVGMFEYLANGVVRNVSLTGISVNGASFVGGLAGASGASVSFVDSDGSVAGVDSVGGLIGANSGQVLRSFSSGSVSAGTGIAGGLIGQNAALVGQSFSVANVSGGSFVGGLVGFSFGFISDSYALGAVSGTTVVGGLVGDNISGTIANSFASGAVTGTTATGGLIGGNPGIVINSYWDMNTSGQSTSTGGTGLTTAQMQQQANFSGWDFVNTWAMLPGVTNPTHKTQVQAVAPVVTPGTLTPAQTLLVQQHQGDSMFGLLLAIADGLFTNSNADPVWVAMYQNGAATAAQVAANAQRNIYDAYTAADIFSQIRAGTLLNSLTDSTWHSIYRNGQPLQTQVDANAFDVTYRNYKGKTAVALFNGIVAGDLSTNPAASNAVVWQALAQQNLSGTNKAAQMAATYGNYKIASVSTLLSALNNATLIEGDTVWNALLVVNSANMTLALSQYKTSATRPVIVPPANSQQVLIASYQNADASTMFQGMLDGDFGYFSAANGYQDLYNNPVWIALHGSNGQFTQVQKDALAAYMMYQSFRNGFSPSASELGQRLYDIPGLENELAWTAFAQDNPIAAAAALKVRDNLVKTQIEANNAANASRTPVITNGNYIPNINMIDAPYIRDLTKYYPYAIGTDGKFHADRLTTADMQMFIASLPDSVNLSFDNFSGPLGDQLNQEKTYFNETWKTRMDDATAAIKDANGITFETVGQYGTVLLKTIPTLVGGVADVLPITRGAVTALRATTSKFASTASYASLELLKILDSNESKLLCLLSDNSAAALSEAAGLIESDQMLKDEMKNFGVTATDLSSGALFEILKTSKFNEFVGNKIAQASTTLVFDSTSGDIKSDTLSTDLLASVGEFIPVFGSIIKENKMVHDVLDKQTPEQKAAFDNFMFIQKEYAEDVKKFNEDTQKQRLQMVIDSANKDVDRWNY